MFLENFFLRFVTSIMPRDILLLSKNLACTQKYYVLPFQKLQKTKKVLRISGQRYKVYIPRCKEKLFFSPSLQTYSLLSGMYFIYRVLLVLLSLKIARILKDILKKTIFKCYNINMLKLQEVGHRISENTNICKNLLKQVATNCNALSTFMQVGYFCYMLLPTKMSCMLTVAV